MHLQDNNKTSFHFNFTVSKTGLSVITETLCQLEYLNIIEYPLYWNLDNN